MHTHSPGVPRSTSARPPRVQSFLGSRKGRTEAANPPFCFAYTMSPSLLQGKRWLFISRLMCQPEQTQSLWLQVAAAPVLAGDQASPWLLPCVRQLWASLRGVMGPKEEVMDLDWGDRGIFGPRGVWGWAPLGADTTWTSDQMPLNPQIVPRK